MFCLFPLKIVGDAQLRRDEELTTSVRQLASGEAEKEGIQKLSLPFPAQPSICDFLI